METEKIKQKISSLIKGEEKVSLFQKLLAVVSYLGVLSLIGMILREKSKPVHFHVKQGIALFVAEIICTLILAIPFIGPIIGLIGWILCVLLSILGLIKAAKGKKWQIPVLGKLATRIKI
ncbi:hypothetical protein B6D52_03375 [Candidatus Parcubacteria bacterium 4484_255]|nr:MAG: hypothetical protein B6D52_03375 [Candidatus Parcubacteria bacterium 4484_255]